MRAGRLVMAVALAIPVWVGAARAADVTATLGLDYDTNLYETPAGPTRGWVNRVVLIAAEDLVRNPRFQAGLSYQGGLKRYWTASRNGSAGPGEVAVNDLSASTGVRLTDAVSVSGIGNVRLKSTHRVPGEEGYLRGIVSVTPSVTLAPRLKAMASCTLGRDASRHDLLSGARATGLSGGLVYSRSRRFRVKVKVERRRLAYDQTALAGTQGGGVFPAGFTRVDRQTGFRASAQSYRGGLLDMVYRFVTNNSNSFGYGYNSHHFRLLYAYAFPWDLEAQAYLNLQARQYSESVPLASFTRPEVDEYEQTSLILKASRDLSEKLGVSARYGYFRNGSVAEGGYYRKQVISISVETHL